MGSRKMAEAALIGEVGSAMALGLDFTAAMCPRRPTHDRREKGEGAGADRWAPITGPGGAARGDRPQCQDLNPQFGQKWSNSFKFKFQTRLKFD
jgi:hypothetical protein